MVEIAAAVSMATSAYNGIKRAIEMGREAQTLPKHLVNSLMQKKVLQKQVLNTEKGLKLKNFSAAQV